MAVLRSWESRPVSGVAGIVLVALLVAIELGRSDPMLHLRLFGDSVGVAVLTTVLLEQPAAYIVGVTGVAATAQAQLQAFHDAFAASIVFGLVGIFFALRIHDQDAAASMQPASSIVPAKSRPPLRRTDDVVMARALRRLLPCGR